MKEEIKQLVEQQLIEDTNHEKHFIINPTKQKPFEKIRRQEKRAAFILSIARFPISVIASIFNRHEQTISRWVEECKKHYPKFK